MIDDPKVDLAFAIQGGEIPADHGYALYAALAGVVETIHEDERIGIHPITGRLTGNRRLAITRASQLIVRLPASRIGALLPVAGSRVLLGSSPLSVGVPSVQLLRPAARLVSRLAVIKGFMEPERFLEAAQRQVTALGVQGNASLVLRRTAAPLEGRSAHEAATPIRRTLRVHDREIVGFSVRVDGLDAADSLRLQEAGLGGRRRFGCGIFVPVPESAVAP